MIGYLTGKVLDTDGKKALICCDNGVGYEVNFGYFLERNAQAAIYIHHHISENDQSLWGFESLADKKMFELLKTVNKVGSSKAYPLITNIGTKGLIEAILLEQTGILTKAPGIGKKMAEQIILSLKDKIEKFQNLQLGDLTPSTPAVSIDGNAAQSFHTAAFNDAILALDSLGYKDKEVAVLIKKQIANGFESTEQIIKNVLREL